MQASYITIHALLTHWPLGDVLKFEKRNFKLNLVNAGWAASWEIAFRWMSLVLTEDKSTLVQVMAWCHQAQAITWANVDTVLCRHVASLGLNELNILVCLIVWFHSMMQLSA